MDIVCGPAEFHFERPWERSVERVQELVHKRKEACLGEASPVLLARSLSLGPASTGSGYSTASNAVAALACTILSFVWSLICIWSSWSSQVR
jgi:hypothetical protein